LPLIRSRISACDRSASVNGVRTSALAALGQPARQRILCAAIHASRRLIEREHGRWELTVGDDRQRQALARLDDRLLADIGLTREAQMVECSKLFWWCP